MVKYFEVERCRGCGGAFNPLFTLGEQYVADFNKDGVGFKAPIELVMCKDCKLVQLKHTVVRDEIYRRYWYKSSVNDSMRKALRDITENAERLVKLKPYDTVMDIGSNDGTLLASYETKKLTAIGFEPAINFYVEATEKVLRQGSYPLILNEYFSIDHFSFGLIEGLKPKIITAIAMFYDLEDPNKFLQDVKEILAPDGIFIIQMNYLLAMIRNGIFDNIEHEHLTYFSVSTLEPLLKRNGFEIFKLDFNSINGGSFRCYIQHKGGPYEREHNSRLRLWEVAERDAELTDPDSLTYFQFFGNARNTANKLHGFISAEKERGKTIYTYGASNRGSCLLQFCGLDDTLIMAAADRNPQKWGLRMVAGNIPVVSEDEARRAKPDYFLILPYSFLPEFLEREKEYLKGGGRFIVPLPKPIVITKSGTVEL